MRIYDLSQKKFITVDDSKIVRKQTVGDLAVSIESIGKTKGSNDKGMIHNYSFVDIIPNTGYGAGLSRVPSNYYTNDSKVEAYFADAGLVAYNLDTFRIYFFFDVEMIEEIDKFPYSIYMTGDSCELIIYKL